MVVDRQKVKTSSEPGRRDKYTGENKQHLEGVETITRTGETDQGVTGGRCFGGTLVQYSDVCCFTVNDGLKNMFLKFAIFYNTLLYWAVIQDVISPVQDPCHDWLFLCGEQRIL